MLNNAVLHGDTAEALFEKEFYFDQALADVIGDLAFTLTRDGGESVERDAAVAAIESELAAVRGERDAAIAGGWVHPGQERECAERELLWERESATLHRQLGSGAGPRTHGSLLGRLLGR